MGRPFEPDAHRVPPPRLRWWVTLVGLLGAVLLNSGCMTTGPVDWVRNGFKVGPNYCRPAAPVAEEWIETKDSNVQNRHLQDWWNVFQDATLNSLIDTAYEQNLTLCIAGTRVLEARTQELIAAYQNRVLTAGREVQTALRAFLRSQEQAENLAQSVKAASAATQRGIQQYRAGTIDFNRVFNLETTQVQQQDQLAVAQGNIALNRINVYRALGGGWELRYQKEGFCQAPNDEGERTL